MGRHRSQPPAVAPWADGHWELRLPAMSLMLEQDRASSPAPTITRPDLATTSLRRSLTRTATCRCWVGRMDGQPVGSRKQD